MTQTVNAPTVGSEPELELLRRLEDGSLREIEVAWSDPFGHAQGKRIPATAFLDRARGSGFAFCEASLGWNSDATVIDSLRLTNWDGGYPDVFAVPDLSTFRVLPWRPGVGHVVSDIVLHDRSPSLLDPRAVLRRVLDRLAALGFTAKVGVELEFYLLEPDGSPFQNDIHAYSLENANALDPLLADLYETLSPFVRLDGIQTEYGPGQVETNLIYTDALEAADDSARLKYAAKEVARRHGKLASFMPKPFSDQSGSSAHVHISLWRDGVPAFAPEDGDRRPARALAVDHPVRRSLRECLSAVRQGLLRTGHRDVESRQPQRGDSIIGRDDARGQPHRIAHRRFGCQPVLVGRVGAGGGDRRRGGRASATRAR
jgi:glutamine synthetase